MKRWLPLTGVCLVIIIAMALALRPFQDRAPSPPRVIVYVEKDGSIALNGQQFADASLLQAALVDACGRKPRPMFYLRTDKATTLDQTGNAMAIAAKAGCLQMNMRSNYSPPGPR